MTQWLSILLLTVSTGLSARYSLDLHGPFELFNQVRSGHLPERIDIYVRGPRQYINKVDTIERLSSAVPNLSLTNYSEISNVLHALVARDYNLQVSNMTKHQGYTYHLLLYEGDTKKVMHYRVFQPTDLQTLWCMVDPETDTGFVYFNDQIGAWLHSHVKRPDQAAAPPKARETNVPPPKREQDHRAPR